MIALVPLIPGRLIRARGDQGADVSRSLTHRQGRVIRQSLEFGMRRVQSPDPNSRYYPYEYSYEYL
eukprot:scaffold415922_cov40-Prasinocladus_malaysianus.AAC.1